MSSSSWDRKKFKKCRPVLLETVLLISFTSYSVESECAPMLIVFLVWASKSSDKNMRSVNINNKHAKNSKTFHSEWLTLRQDAKNVGVRMNVVPMLNCGFFLWWNETKLCNVADHILYGWEDLKRPFQNWKRFSAFWSIVARN